MRKGPRMVNIRVIYGFRACKRAREGNPFSSESDERDVEYVLARTASRKNKKPIDKKYWDSKRFRKMDKNDNPNVIEYITPCGDVVSITLTEEDGNKAGDARTKKKGN